MLVPGNVLRNDCTNSGMTMGARVENQPTDNSPRNCWLMSAAAEYSPSACFINCFESRSIARPAGVKDKPCA